MGVNYLLPVGPLFFIVAALSAMPFIGVSIIKARARAAEGAGLGS
jgi:hypothetical protein